MTEKAGLVLVDGGNRGLSHAEATGRLIVACCSYAATLDGVGSDRTDVAATLAACLAATLQTDDALYHAADALAHCLDLRLAETPQSPEKRRRTLVAL